MLCLSALVECARAHNDVHVKEGNRSFFWKLFPVERSVGNLHSCIGRAYFRYSACSLCLLSDQYVVFKEAVTSCCSMATAPEMWHRLTIFLRGGEV